MTNGGDMRREDMEKEIRVTEAVYAQLRNKRADLEAENHRLFNEKIAIQKDINSLLDDKNVLVGEVSQLKNKIMAVDETIKKDKFMVAKERGELDQTRSQLNEEWAKLDKKKDELEKIYKGLSQESAKIKAQDNLLLKKEAELRDAQILLNNKLKTLGIEDRRLQSDRSDVKGIENATIIKLNEAQNAIKESLVEKNKFIRKFQEIEGLKATLSKSITESNAMANDLKRAIAEQKKIAMSLQEKEANLSERENQLSNKLKELETEKNAFDVKCLRLEKAIRDDDIRNELARLKTEREK